MSNRATVENWRKLGIEGTAGALGVNEIPENPYNTPVIVQGYKKKYKHISEHPFLDKEQVFMIKN